MSREFKAGDKVKVLTTGKVGTIAAVRDPSNHFDVLIPDYRGVSSVTPGAGVYHAENLEHVEPEPQFRKGDRVRVTFEAEYDEDFGTVGHKFLGGRTYVSNGVDNLDIVKVQDSFQPGDVVREISSDRLFVLGKDGYFQLTPEVGKFWEYRIGEEEEQESIALSFPHNDGDYEKVEYAEVPF